MIAKETRKTPAVTINLAVRAGSIADPASALGAMHLLSRVIDRGTSTRSASEIALALEDRGISLNTVVTRHLFTFTCTCLTADFEHVLTLLADILAAPTVPEAELEIRRGELVTALHQDEDNPAVRSVEALMAMLYGAEHPYGRRARGTIESVETITRDELLRLHAAHFVPRAVSLVVVGDVAADRALETAAAAFGSWADRPAADHDLPRAATSASRRRLVIPMMNKAQTDIAYGFVTIMRSDPSYYAWALMNNVFGQYALGGRLGTNIRERQGMAYYVSSVFDPNRVEGPLMVRAGVSAANVDRAIAAIDQEVRSLASDGVSREELEESRLYMIGSLPRSLETNHGIAQFLQTAEFFDLGTEHDVRMPDYLRAVTVDDIREVARTHLDPDRAAVVIAGPYAD